MESPLFPSHLFDTDFESVYEPSEDTFLLMDAIEQDLQIIKDKVKPLICVEVGCGSGAVITSLAKALGPNNCLYFGTDVNGKALLTTQKCFAVNGVEGRVQLIRTDLTQAIDHRLDNSIDVLIFNPPYVPTPDHEVGFCDIRSSWAGGQDGRRVIDRFLHSVPSLLTSNGFLYLIVVKENNIHEICRLMNGLNFEMTVLLERKCGSEHLKALRFNRISMFYKFL